MGNAPAITIENNTPDGKSNANENMRNAPAIRIENNTPDGTKVVPVQQADSLSDEDEEIRKPKVPSAVGNRVIEGDDDDSRAALAHSFWGPRKNKLPVYQEPENKFGGTYIRSSDGKDGGGSGTDQASTSGYGANNSGRY